MTEKAVRLKKCPFALTKYRRRRISACRRASLPIRTRAPHASKPFYGKRFHRGTLGTRCVPLPCPPMRPRALRRATNDASGHVASRADVRAVFFLGISAAALSPDADRRRLPAPFLQAKFCDSLTDQSQSISVPLAQSRDHKQLSLSPYIARTNTRRHATQQCLAQSSRTSNLPP